MSNPAYPQEAGWQDTDTSFEAAPKPRRTTELQARVLEHIREAPMTADEVAAKMGMSILVIRPRVTELKKMKKIIDTGMRGLTEMGKKAIVYKEAT